MRETLQNVYLGHSTTIKNKTYFSSRQYIEPFVNATHEYAPKIICEVKTADQLDGDGTQMIYNRALIMAIGNDEFDFEIRGIVFHRVICMSYALDTKKPICKFYTGVVDPDLNFYAFGDNCMSIQEIEPENALDYSYINTIWNNGLRDNCRQMIEQLVISTIPKTTDTLGQWVDFALKKEYYNEAGKVRMSTTLPIDVYKSLALDQDSDLYTEDDDLSMFYVLKSFSSFISEDKDLNNRYEKIQLVNKLLEL